MLGGTNQMEVVIITKIDPQLKLSTLDASLKKVLKSKTEHEHLLTYFRVPNKHVVTFIVFEGKYTPT